MRRRLDTREDTPALIARGARFDAVAWVAKVATVQEVEAIAAMPERDAGHELTATPPRGARLPLDLEPEFAGAYWTGFHGQVGQLESALKDVKASRTPATPGRRWRLFKS